MVVVVVVGQNRRHKNGGLREAAFGGVDYSTPRSLGQHTTPLTVVYANVNDHGFDVSVGFRAVQTLNNTRSIEPRDGDDLCLLSRHCHLVLMEASHNGVSKYNSFCLCM
ncbi:hypothetical protein BaRGS_00004178 [Batillaria attramentaria]|uniref:Uncharacterized protein n=1 Tax=Batillaria attramentaria TaxID=370345 RepID=A0ABD0LYU9_9CAEN